MDMPANQVGQEGPSLGWCPTTGPAAHAPPWRCYIWRSAHFLADMIREEVVRMWKRKLLKALLTVIFTVMTAILLTTKACW